MSWTYEASIRMKIVHQITTDHRKEKVRVGKKETNPIQMFFMENCMFMLLISQISGNLERKVLE